MYLNIMKNSGYFGTVCIIEPLNSFKMSQSRSMEFSKYTKQVWFINASSRHLDPCGIFKWSYFEINKLGM